MVHLRHIPPRAFYDLVFIGSGLSSTYSLIQALDRLRERPCSAAPVKVLVLERAGDAYGGLAYGQRAGRTALLTTSFRDFLPSPERERFIAWLTAHWDGVFHEFEEAGGRAAREWLARNRPHMEAGRWDGLYLPRFLFGRFLGDWARQAIDAARDGVADCAVAHADVTDVRARPEGFEIDAESDGHAVALRGRKLVLAVGQPPQWSIAAGLDDRGLGGVCVIDHLYAPSLHENVARAKRRLDQAAEAERGALIVGGNAAALEAIYHLANRGGPGTRFSVLSPAGRLPERIDDSHRAHRPFVPETIDSLCGQPAITAAQIHQAVQADLRAARARGLTVASTYEPITRAISRLFEKLSCGERERFCCRYGVEIGRLQRRAGGEYCDAVDRLAREHRIEHIRGRYAGSLSVNGRGFEFDVRDDGGGIRPTAVRASVVVNCAGPERLSATTSPLLGNLLRRKLCVANPSDRGFIVDDRLEATRHLHVIGPLLAGNIIGGAMIWHVEHCGRIMQLAQRLAATLADDLSATGKAAS